jgi:hypothetical protein
MIKFSQFMFRNLGLAAILVIACVCVHPVFGQQVKATPPEKDLSAKSEEPMIRIIRIAHGDSENIAGTIANVMPENSGMKLSCDKRSNIIVLKGTREDVDVALKLITQLDSVNPGDKTRSIPASVRIFWLVDGDKSAAAPSDNLKGVVEELHQLGLTKVGQVAQAIVRCQNEGQFQISCSPNLGNTPIMLSVEGRILTGEGLQVHITATRHRDSEAAVAAADKTTHSSATRTTEQLIDLDVNTVYKSKDYIVLAVAPIGNIPSVFVIQITNSDP